MIGDFYSEHTVRGRREYRCQHCRDPIGKGSPHVAVSSCSGGVLHAHRAHIDCHETATGQPAPSPRSTKARPLALGVSAAD